MNRDVCEHSVPTHLYCDKCAFLIVFRQLQQTHRHEWQGLTEEERARIIEYGSTLDGIARAIEQALKEKNA
jgi:hypothetical protein